MPATKTPPGHDLRQEEVLTLPEAASFLRVSEEDVSKLLAQGAIPAQQIGSEWRFLKRALADWLATNNGPTVKRGSKQAVLKHFGIFKDDPEIEGLLRNIYVRRKADEQ